jgi:hypothetical protein
MYLLCADIRRKPLNELVGQGTGLDKLALNQFSRRYIFHLLARITASTDKCSGRPDPFPTLVDRQQKNPFDIEHIWASDYALHQGMFATQQEFELLRDTFPALLLLPADVNRSLQDKPYAHKLQKYASHNLYTASLAPGAYINQPQFEAFRSKHGLGFRAHQAFTKDDWADRQRLVAQLVELVWSPERLKAYSS